MTLKSIPLILALSACILFSCSDDNDVPSAVQKLDIELDVHQRSIRDKGNDFANTLLIQASKEDDNVLLSPLSLQFVLCMIANGADEEAYTELLNTLGLADYSLEELNAFHQTVLEGIGNNSEKLGFSLNNAVWVQEGFSVNDSFLDKMKSCYNASVGYLDFGQVEYAKKAINEWASQATNSTIKDLQLPLNASTKLVLNNACCFDGQWSFPFDEKKTQEGDFMCGDGSVAKVKFMQSKEDMTYVAQDGYAQVVIGFSNGFSMLVALPDEGKTLEEVLPLVDWMSPKNLDCVTVDLKLPKFELNLVKNLNKTLQEMDICRIYASGSLPNLADNLAVSLIQQNTSMSIDESGVKASVTTSGTMDPTAGELSVVKMELNRPFAFAIRENSSKTLFFVGKVACFK